MPNAARSRRQRGAPVDEAAVSLNRSEDRESRRLGRFDRALERATVEVLIACDERWIREGKTGRDRRNGER
jgi:hypothetical protein